MTHVNWHGDDIIRGLQGKGPHEVGVSAWKRVMQAATYLKAQIQKNVSILTEASGPSRPGEYPHIGYHPPIPGGTLRKSIFVRPRKEELKADIGTKLVYGVHWETTNRPYIRRTYAEQLGQIKAILEGRMTRTIDDIRAEAAEMKERHQAQKAAILAKKDDKKASDKAKKLARRQAAKAYKSGVRQRKTARKAAARARRQEYKKAVATRRAARRAATKARRQAKDTEKRIAKAQQRKEQKEYQKQVRANKQWSDKAAKKAAKGTELQKQKARKTWQQSQKPSKKTDFWNAGEVTRWTEKRPPPFTSR